MTKATQPLTQFQSIVRLSAHYAAQQKVIEHVQIVYDQLAHPSVDLTAKQRKVVLNDLESCGFGKFLLTNGLVLECTVSASRKTDEDSATTSCYDVNEVQAYLDYTGDDSTPLEFMKEDLEYGGNYSGIPGRWCDMGQYVQQKRNRIVVTHTAVMDI